MDGVPLVLPSKMARYLESVEDAEKSFTSSHTTEVSGNAVLASTRPIQVNEHLLFALVAAREF